MIDAKEFIQKHAGIIETALNDYMKWFDEGSDNYNSCEEAIKDLSEAENIEAEYFSVNSISKDDLREIFSDKNVGHKKIMEQIDNLTEEDLKEIASKTADGICDSGAYRQALECAFQNWSENK